VIDDAIKMIKTLNPKPGRLYSSAQVQYVIPDVIVENIDGRWEVRLEDTYIPRIHISKHYQDMLREQKDDPKVRAYIKKKIESAKWLIESIEQRQNTLFKIAREIVEYQTPFLEHGIDALRPLKMQFIADRVGVHVSTVSRAIADKYMQTPRGIFALKFFFTGGTTRADGEEKSIVAVKQKVRDIVGKEDKTHPLSDEEIAAKLKEEGLDIARRTVTKYRKQLGIPSSRQRRKYVND
jgi:RNA polymerase sigma-54 factor